MKVKFKNIKEMDLEFFILIMKVIIKVNFKMVNLMEKENIIQHLLDGNIKVILKKEKNMVMDVFKKIIIHIKEIF